MEEKQMTLKECLQVTVQLIESITVPVKFSDQISRPLCQAVANLNSCIAAIPDVKEGDDNGVGD